MLLYNLPTGNFNYEVGMTSYQTVSKQLRNRTQRHDFVQLIKSSARRSEVARRLMKNLSNKTGDIPGWQGYSLPYDLMLTKRGLWYVANSSGGGIS